MSKVETINTDDICCLFSGKKIVGSIITMKYKWKIKEAQPTNKINLEISLN